VRLGIYPHFSLYLDRIFAKTLSQMYLAKNKVQSPGYRLQIVTPELDQICPGRGLHFPTAVVGDFTEVFRDGRVDVEAFYC